MNKEELARKIEEENIASALLPYTIELGAVLHDEPLTYGYGYENGKWKVYDNNEQNHQIVIKEFTNESDVIDYMYQFLQVRYELASQDY